MLATIPRSAMLILALALVSILVVACAPAATPATASPIAISDTTTAELEAVLRVKADAIRRGDRAAFQSTIDLDRNRFKVCWNETFDEAGRGSIRSWALATKIVKLEPYLDAYLRAYVQEGLGVARRYFRRSGERWVLTEPRDNELGSERRTAVGPNRLEVTHWAIDDDIVDLLTREASATWDFLMANARSVPRSALAFLFYPTRTSAGAGAPCWAVGHRSGNPDDPAVRFIGAWLGLGLGDVSADMRATFRHEGLHWLQDQFAPGNSARLDFWLREGWPDYLAGVSRPGTVKRLLCSPSAVPRYKELAAGPAADATGDVVGDYYAYSVSMIEYLYAQFGKDAYWDLMSAYKAGVDPNVNLPQVLKVTPQQFYDGWLAFAKKKYC